MATEEQVVVMGRRKARPEPRGANAVMDRLWNNDQVVRSDWVQFFCAAIQGGESIGKAARDADRAYYEFFRRCNGLGATEDEPEAS